MLRLPAYRYHRPDTLDEALDMLARHGPDAMLISGGTDLVPNMKHGLFTPAHLVSLNRVEAMRGIRVEGDDRDGMNGRAAEPAGTFLAIGALETLADVAAHPAVRLHAPAVAQAAGLVAGPQLRNMGTIGGNACLDTRCTYYNQTRFWRHALGYCLKKDGDICHVTKVGRKCVAAHSADTPSALIAHDSVLTLAGPSGARDLAAADFFVPDGIRNTRRADDEILTRIRIPLAPGRRSAYRKLRQRASIDFPLLSVAVAADIAADGTVAAVKGVVSALGARPRILSGWVAIAVGTRLEPDVVQALAERARRQCRPLDNIVVDPEWRRAMVPVYAKRALRELARDRPNGGASQ